MVTGADIFGAFIFGLFIGAVLFAAIVLGYHETKCERENDVFDCEMIYVPATKIESQ